MSSVLSMDGRPFPAIERQLEDLHNHFRPRSAKRRHFFHSDTFPQKARHIDVLEAIFSSQRPLSSLPSPPLTLFNEDVAERNLQSPPVYAPDSYTRLRSALYQEDVADRNIPQDANRLSSRASSYSLRHQKSAAHATTPKLNHTFSLSHSPMGGSPSIASDRETILSSGSEGDSSSCLLPITRVAAQVHEEESPPKGLGLQNVSKRNQQSDAGVVSDRFSNLNNSVSEGSRNHHAPSMQGRKPTTQEHWSHKSGSERAAENKQGHRQHGPLSHSQPCGFSHRKNVRGLSITMDVAAPSLGTFVKVGPRSTGHCHPESHNQNPTFPEIVQSPISVANLEPKEGDHKIEELINLLRRAYTEFRSPSPCPVSESLQDTIVREINYHDAFRQIYTELSLIPTPEASPVTIRRDQQEPVRRYSLRRFPSTNFSRKERYQRHQSQKSSLSESEHDITIPRRELSIPALKDLESNRSPIHEPYPKEHNPQMASPYSPNLHKSIQSLKTTRPSSSPIRLPRAAGSVRSRPDSLKRCQSLHSSLLPHMNGMPMASEGKLVRSNSQATHDMRDYLASPPSHSFTSKSSRFSHPLY